jgi:hypothetical protein
MYEVKTLIRSIAVMALLPFVCALLWAIGFGASNISAQQEIEQQLAELDKQFRVARGQISAEINSAGFFPQQIGNFQRETGINDYKCLSDTGFPRPCYSAHYSLDKSNFQSWVFVTILKKSSQGVSQLDNLVGRISCGDMIANRRLRMVSQIPYLYGTCPFGLFAPTQLNEITWENGDWFVEVHGQYNTISQFIAAYPY